MTNKSKVNIKPEMERFMVSTIFGYDITEEDDDKKKLKEACAGRAYLDLSRVIPYLFSTSDIDEKKSGVDTFSEKKEEFKKIVKDKLLEINKNSDPQIIIKEIYDFAKEDSLKRQVFKKNNEFTIGMTQKWVNMYLKYLWLFGYDNIPIEKMQMPIDSYIIDALCKSDVLVGDFCQKNGLLKPNKKFSAKMKRPSENIIPWSQWNAEQYKAVQKRIKERAKKENKSILEWENELWIEQAKKLREEKPTD